MKKIYEAPMTEEVKVELQRMIAESPGTPDAGLTDTELEPGDVGSRDAGSFFGDDDE